MVGALHVCVCALCVYMHVYVHCMCVCVTYIYILCLVPDRSPGITNITSYANNVTFILNPIMCLEQNGPLQLYMVQYVNMANAACSLNGSQMQTTMDSNVVIDGLRAYTTYCIRVSRVNINSLNGSYSEWVNITTQQSSKHDM